MNIAQLECFVEASRCGSLSAAAVRQNVSVQALSRRVRDLENELGVNLFMRTNTGITTTEKGLILLPHAEAAVEAFRRCQDPAIFTEHRPKVRIALCSPHLYQEDLFCAYIEQFLLKSTDTEVQLELFDKATADQLLESGEIDLAFTVGRPTDWPDRKFFVLGTLPLAALVACDNEFSGRDMVSLSEFADRYPDRLSIHPGYYFFRDEIVPMLSAHGVRCREYFGTGAEFCDDLAQGRVVTLAPYISATKEYFPSTTCVPLDPCDGLSVKICAARSAAREPVMGSVLDRFCSRRSMLEGLSQKRD